MLVSRRHFLTGMGGAALVLLTPLARAKTASPGVTWTVLYLRGGWNGAAIFSQALINRPGVLAACHPAAAPLLERFTALRLTLALGVGPVVRPRSHAEALDMLEAGVDSPYSSALRSSWIDRFNAGVSAEPSPGPMRFSTFSGCADALEAAGRVAAKAPPGIAAVVHAPGWDTHADEPAQLTHRLGDLCEGLDRFDHAATGARCTPRLLILSECGRTLTPNSFGGTSIGMATAACAIGEPGFGGRVVGSWKAVRDAGGGFMQTTLPQSSFIATMLSTPVQSSTSAASLH